jgi:hypothetical protein
VNTVQNLRVPQNAGNFLNIGGSVSQEILCFRELVVTNIMNDVKQIPY